MARSIELAATAAHAALADFEEDLGRVDQLLGLILDFRRFAATNDYESKAEHWEDAFRLMERAQAVRTDLPVLSGSLLMYVCGRFEHFVRALVGSIVDDLVDKSAEYGDLPEPLRREHLQRTLQINQNPSKYNLSKTAAITYAGHLAASLSPSGDKQESLYLDSSIITITESNMNSETIADLFRRVDVKQLWDMLGKQFTLQVHLGKATESDCTRAAKEKLDEIMSIRNKVAHPTMDTAFPDADSVQGIADYLLVLGRALVELSAVAMLKHTINL